MTKYLEDKKASHILIIVCFLTYTIIALTRNAYAAAIASIVAEGYFTKSDAGIVATSFSITYCVSQIIGSYYVDRFSPFKVIFMGALVTIFANIAMSLTPTYWVIFISRGLCGVAQFGIWPALLRILSEYVNKEHRRVWRYILPLGVTLGYVISYLAIAAIPEWRGIFTLSYISLAVATVIFVITVIYAQKKAVTLESKSEISANEDNMTKKENTQNISVFRLLTSSGALILMIPIFAQALIGNGIGSWMPTMIMESYNVSPAISSIMTTISTAAKFVAVVWVMIFYPRVFKQQTTMMGMLLLFAVPFLASSIFIGKLPMISVVVFITIIQTFKGSIHQLNTVEIPKVYTKYNRSGMVAGLINAVATFAGVISSWLWGWMAESYSWDVIITVWTVMALVSSLICFAVTPLWKKFSDSKI
ncbi:MAG: MFS transporter [Ruminococcaceae bacterium]|nr:MFS transporter [Oscillospiraceae bacterium]